MTRDQALDVVSMVQLLWPQAVLPRETPDLWAKWFADTPVDQVEAAVRDYSVAGREFPPTVGMVVEKIADRADVLPTADQMRAEFFRLLRAGFSHDRPPAEDDYAHPLLAAFFHHPSSAGWKEWCVAKPGDGTFYAQQRDAYAALRHRVQRDRGLHLIGAPLPARRRELRRFGEGLELPVETAGRS